MCLRADVKFENLAIFYFVFVVVSMLSIIAVFESRDLIMLLFRDKLVHPL